MWGAPHGAPAEVYRGHVRTRENEVRESVVIGHRLEVYLDGDGRWNVAVDGEELLARSGTAYSAWAVGAAESYRQGRVEGSLPVTD
jgi:hypothetical protein